MFLQQIVKSAESRKFFGRLNFEIYNFFDFFIFCPCFSGNHSDLRFPSLFEPLDKGFRQKDQKNARKD
jgi:hypothetical protein